jgi:hypothetical protein
MVDKLPKMDRWHSEVLDVHTWSDHPEIKVLCDRLYTQARIDSLEKIGNRKPKRTVKDSLRTLVLDLYVKWLKKPSLSIGFSKTKRSYKVSSRYNALFISDKIIQVEELLVDAGYIEELPAFHDITGYLSSYSTRIRHTQKLRDLFANLTIDLQDIDTHKDQECIVLHEKYVNGPDDYSSKKVDYQDKDLSSDAMALVSTLRGQLQAYNNLLKYTFIDIPSYEKTTVTRLIEDGPFAGREQTVSLGPDNKFVKRVFNGGLSGNWELGGRFYGGWWQQINKEDRSKIYINDQPTLEVDFKALHPNLLSNELGVSLPNDPYDLGELLLPEVLTTPQVQRSYVKLLILMAINSDNAKKAFQALRNHNRKDKIGQRLTDVQLSTLLDKVIEKYPHFDGFLNTGQALRLMWIDSQIANLVLGYFTQKNVPVLCIHDSFIIQYDKEPELRRIMEQATQQLTQSTIDQDIKNSRNTHITQVSGNIKGYEEKGPLVFYTPIRTRPTKQYEARKEKFSRWSVQSNTEY